ncbi:MAG: hypothetical protein P4M05_05420 [Bradyrhizobium sp.]|nr:hypothetical protein [Bradyrhizobium sp.]
MLEKTSITQQLIEIGAACGETAGILEISYLRTAHQRRQRIIDAVGSAAADGRITTPERLYAWLGEIPVQAQANLGAERYAAELFGVLANPKTPSPLAQEALDLAANAKSQADRDPLAGAAILFRGRDAVTPASRAAYSLFLRHALGPGEPALSPLLLGIEAAARRPAPVFDAYVTERLSKASRRALANARTLRNAVATVYTVLGKARTSSRVHAIAELLFAGHPLSIASASKIFRISRLAARKHLIRLERDGLAELATRRKSGLVYTARDGLMTFNQAGLTPTPKASTRLAVASGKPLSAEERTRLEAVADDVAGQMHDLDRMLARLNAKAEGKG